MPGASRSPSRPRCRDRCTLSTQRGSTFPQSCRKRQLARMRCSARLLRAASEWVFDMGALPSSQDAPIQQTLAFPCRPVGSRAAHVLSPSASLSLAGVPDQPPAATASPANGAGRSFHLNSATGDGGNDGRSASLGIGSGPWRTLARLTTSGLAAGDTVLLASGSVWHEPLHPSWHSRPTATWPRWMAVPAAPCSRPAPTSCSPPAPRAVQARGLGCAFKTRAASG